MTQMRPVFASRAAMLSRLAETIKVCQPKANRVAMDPSSNLPMRSPGPSGVRRFQSVDQTGFSREISVEENHVRRRNGCRGGQTLEECP